MVDLEIDTHISFAPGTIWAKAFKTLLPRNALCFLIQRDFRFVREERPEHALDRNFPERFRLFQRLVKDPRVITIQNNGSLRNAVSQAMAELRRHTPHSRQSGN